MFIDVIKYELAEGVTEEFLQGAAKEILQSWMKKQPGFLKWEIGRSKEKFTDFVYWTNREAAELATTQMKEIPSDHPWLKCYNMKTISSEKIENLLVLENRPTQSLNEFESERK